MLSGSLPATRGYVVVKLFLGRVTRRLLCSMPKHLVTTVRLTNFSKRFRHVTRQNVLNWERFFYGKAACPCAKCQNWWRERSSRQDRRPERYLQFQTYGVSLIYDCVPCSPKGLRSTAFLPRRWPSTATSTFKIIKLAREGIKTKRGKSTLVQRITNMQAKFENTWVAVHKRFSI